MRLTGKAAGAFPGTRVRVGQEGGLCQERPTEPRLKQCFPQSGPQTAGHVRADGAPWTNSSPFILLLGILKRLKQQTQDYKEIKNSTRLRAQSGARQGWELIPAP